MGVSQLAGFYDAEFRRYGVHVRAAANFGPRDRASLDPAAARRAAERRRALHAARRSDDGVFDTRASIITVHRP